MGIAESRTVDVEGLSPGAGRLDPVGVHATPSLTRKPDEVITRAAVVLAKVRIGSIGDAHGDVAARHAAKKLLTECRALLVFRH